MTPVAKTQSLACTACSAAISEELAAGLCTQCLNLRLGQMLTRGSPTASDTSVELPAGFEYVELLGRGGMGVVYLAYQRELGRYVALKYLGPAWRQQAKARERFLQEASAAGRLSHPGIVPVWEVGSESDAAWYAMEYVEGGDLSQLLAQRGALPWREAIALVAAICDAIDYAHRAGVVHRDLKPSNILLGGDGRPKVTDFGLAWVTGQELKELTATSEILGTPAYMAPEWISGRQRESEAKRADIYSLGALLFHSIAGHPPFVAEHPMQTLAAIANKPAPRLVAAPGNDAVPWYVAEACARCLSKSPADRFGSAAELGTALRECLHGRSAGARVATFLRARRRQMIVGALAAAIASAGFYFVRAAFMSRVKAGGGLAAVSPSSPAAQPQYRTIAVMPFVAASADEASKLTAAGMQDAVIAALTRLTELKVLAAASAREAAATTQDSRELRRLLGIDVQLSASVQKWQDTIRVTAQLIDPRDNSVLWSQSYDRHETNLLNLQTDVATDIAVRLGAPVRADSAGRLRGATSLNAEAQQLLAKARQLTSDASASVADLDEAERSLDRAVALDPQFALAFARLAELHVLKYHWGNDRSERRLGLGLSAAQAALRINPQLPEAEIALGNYYYRGSRDYATARPHFERALALSPHIPEALEGLGYLERRMGDFAAAAGHLQQALALKPLDAVLAYNVADTFLRLAQYRTAAAVMDDALGKHPGQVALMKLRGDLYLAWKGDLGPMREDIRQRRHDLPTKEIYLFDRIELLVLENRIDEALQVLRASDFRRLDAQSILLTRRGYEAMLLRLRGEMVESKALAESALVELTDTLRRRPNDARVLLHAAQLQAIAGRAEEADRLAKRTITEGDPACVDAFDRGYFLRCIAILYAGLGQADAARQTVKVLLAAPSQYSEASLRLHPALARIL